MANVSNFHCNVFPVQTCGNCASCCEQEDESWAQGCVNWRPCRGGHPSTPNPCEGVFTRIEEFPLCMNECTNCVHNTLQ